MLGDEVTDVTTNSEGTLVGTLMSDLMLSSFGSESTPPSPLEVPGDHVCHVNPHCNFASGKHGHMYLCSQLVPDRKRVIVVITVCRVRLC